jgi:hypothetical protein
MSEGAKNIRLRSPMPKEKFVAKLAATLKAGGQVETPPAEPKIGDKMPDGTVFAGISPDTHKPMYTTPAPAPLTMTFNEAEKYATKLDAHGHQDWRLPTKAELNLLFNNRAAIGVFYFQNSSGWYWSSLQCNTWDAWGQRFSDDGFQSNHDKDSHLSVRCVR